MTDDDAATGDEQEPTTPDEQSRWHDSAVLTAPQGREEVFVERERWVEVVQALRDEDRFEVCIDLCGVDYLTHPGRRLPEGVAPERFEVVVNLLSMHHRRRVQLRAQVPETDPSIPTLYEVYPGTDAMEREAFDMFGIVFEGHPDLSRILMPEDWDGYPLRKDYGVGRIPVQFKSTEANRR